MKSILKEIGSGEFRKKGFSPKTFKAAINGRVKPETQKKIMAAIESYKQEKENESRAT